MTRQLFAEDAYLSTYEAKVVDVSARGGIILDATNFYATSGGQPGDTGFLERADGTKVQIATTVYDEGGKETIIHIPAEGEVVPEIGEPLVAHIDWDRRYRLMQMHTACHLLSVICPLPITGASVSEADSRIDFDMTDTADKAELTERMMELISANHPVFTRWITEAELDANPDLVKSKNVKPPRGVGKIRLVCIGEDAAIDSQPCGGTHVSETGELGAMHIGKIEKKGRENRRMRIRFGKLPQG
ncbi:alanyl-tRNA editing protein [Pseudahrensia aquimaris]|uniref:Alanine--tRNA ligase n=1 Tax=Pseudahrensia aquimaris TaxID=744461 RepID=A0ABW3FG28_9HYPH